MAVPVTRRALDVGLAVLILLVPTVFLRSNLKDPGKLNFLDRAVLFISAPLQTAATWAIDGVGSAFSRYVWLVDVQEDNDELRRENDRLRQRLAAALQGEDEVKELEQLVELRDRLPADTIGARVVALGTNPFFRVSRILLDRGEGDVTAGMPVLSVDGVVGRIQRIYGRYADVLLASDPQLAIDVVVARTGGRGVLKGVGGENGYACRIDYLVRDDDVKEGDRVVTSGLGGVFPQGVSVGRVRRVKAAQYGLYQDVEVEPAVAYSRLSKVLVILAPPPPPDPTAKSKKISESAFGVVPYK